TRQQRQRQGGALVRLDDGAHQAHPSRDPGHGLGRDDDRHVVADRRHPRQVGGTADGAGLAGGRDRDARDRPPRLPAELRGTREMVAPQATKLEKAYLALVKPPSPANKAPSLSSIVAKAKAGG